MYESEITSLCNSAKGIIIGDALGEVYLLESITSTERKFLTKVQGRVNSIGISNDLVVVAGNQENLVVLQSGGEKQVYEGCRSHVVYVSISPNGKFIGAFGQDGWVYLYADLKLVKKTQFTSKIKEDHLEQFISEFSPDNNCFALPGDMMINYLQAPDWKYIPSSMACKQNISIMRWPREKTIITASLDNQIRIWDLVHNETIQTISLLSSPWDLKLLENKHLIVALSEKTEVFKDIKLFKEILEIIQEEPEKQENEEDKALFDRTLGVYPQEAIIQGNNDKSFSVLFRSALGAVISREYYSHTTAMAKIEIEFDDLNFHQNISFPNNHDFTLAYIGENGVLLASQVFDVELDDFVADHKASFLFFRAFGSDTTWESKLPSNEYPESLCVTTCCTVYTSINYLRVFTLGGLQTLVISMSGPVVTMAGHLNKLAIIYHSAAPVLGCQSLTGEIWDIDEIGVESEAPFFKDEFKVAITPGERIAWMGYSDTGVLYTVDSAKVLRGLWKRAMNWVPLCTLQDYTRVVGVTEVQVMLNLTENYKRIDLQDFEVPLCKGKSQKYEQNIITKHFIIENQTVEVDKQKIFLELDKFTLQFYTDAIDEGDGDRAYAYGIQAKSEKTKRLFVKYAQELKVFSVAERLAKYFKIPYQNRFARPERAIEEVKYEEEKKVEARNGIKEVTKENIEKPQQLVNPFAKNTNQSKDLFEALNTNLKRKPEEIQAPLKKLKK